MTKIEIDKLGEDTVWWNKCACIIQTITIAWQFSIVMVFWVFCAPVYFTYDVPWWWNAGLVEAHMVPFIGVLINFYYGKSRVRLELWWMSLFVTFLYVMVNLYFTKKLGVPVYPFLTWESSWTALYCFGCWAFGYICLLLSSFIQEWRLVRPFANCF